jgi:hypothetical protein
MTIKLKDAPGGAELISSLADAIKDLSLLYAGTPDHRAVGSLSAYIEEIRPDLVEAVGSGLAARILGTFTNAVMGRKHQIEAGGASRA